MSTTLTAEQEVQARELAAQLQLQAGDSFLAIARLLVATDEASLFGATEFAIRQHALHLISQAYSGHLAQKKTATAAPRSTARSAAKPPRFMATGNETP